MPFTRTSKGDYFVKLTEKNAVIGAGNVGATCAFVAQKNLEILFYLTYTKVLRRASIEYVSKWSSVKL